MGAGTHHFVAYHQTAGRQGCKGERAFPSGSRAQVEIAHGTVDKAAQHMVEEHRGGLLHIVEAAMQPGVEGKGRSGIVGLPVAFGRVEAQAGLRFGGEGGFKIDIFVTQQAAHTGRKLGR